MRALKVLKIKTHNFRAWNSTVIIHQIKGYIEYLNDCILAELAQRLLKLVLKIHLSSIKIQNLYRWIYSASQLQNLTHLHRTKSILLNFTFMSTFLSTCVHSDK